MSQPNRRAGPLDRRKTPRPDSPDRRAPSGECLERRRPQLVGMLCRIDRDCDAAQEAAGDAVAEGLRLISKGTAGELRNRVGWLFTTARNRYVQLRRAKQRRFGREQAVAKPPVVNEPDFVERRELAEAVRNAIAALPEHLRPLVELCLMDDMSYRRAAAVLGIPPGAARSRLDKARRLLAELLAEFA